MQIFGLQMCVVAQHFPILMSGDERHLFDRVPCLEKATGAFVTQVMKVKVLDVQLSALSTKGCTDRPSIVRKYPATIGSGQLALLVNDLTGVIAADVQQRDALIIAAFPPRVLAVPYEEHLVFTIEISPFNATDFVLTHRCRHREANNTAQGNLLSRVRIERRDEPVEFMLRSDVLATTLFGPSFSATARVIERKSSLLASCSMKGSETPTILRFYGPSPARGRKPTRELAAD